MTQRFDIAVIGGGPGGYPAAICAAQSGKSVALIEKGQMGGTCLNRGCIPSKALIAGAEAWRRLADLSHFGIHVDNPRFDFAQLARHKEQTVEKIRKSLEGLIASNRITVFRGFGQFLSPREIQVAGEESLSIYAEKTIIATGSEPRALPHLPFDYEKIHDSTSLLDLKTLPNRIVIIGGGVIGSEFASLYASLGTQVAVVETLPSLLPTEGEDISRFLAKSFAKKGILLEMSVTADKIEKNGYGVLVALSNGKILEADMALIAVGRTLNTKDIGLEKAGVALEPNGMIKTNAKMETSAPGIYAVGDIASKYWLAHVATHQGLVAARNAIGQEAFMHYEAIPNVIFTDPEIGTVGLSLEEARKKGFDAVIGSFPFQALGKSQATIQTEGFAQTVIDQKTGQILGAQAVGHEASALIAEMALALANELTVECVTETIHAHPTIAEAWLEAALLAQGTPLHLPLKKTKKN